MNEPPLDRASLSAFASAMLNSSRARDLSAKYRLSYLSEQHLYLGTLFLTDLFDTLREEAPEYFAELPENLHILEIGPKDFESAPALAAVFHPRQLTGVELEPDRLDDYGVTSSARAHARLAALNLEHNYLGLDLFDYRGRHNFLVWLHPFLDEARLREWGLPSQAFRPRELFAHALTLLEPGAYLSVVNQERGEFEAQAALFAEHSSQFRRHRALEIPLWFRANDEPAYVHLAQLIG